MATIQIADNDARVQYTQAVTADTTQLTIDFPFFSLDDIEVRVVDENGLLHTPSRGTGADTFAVVGTAVDDGFSGGYVTLGDTYTSSSTSITIFRDITAARTTDFPTSGPFNIAALNTELDKTMALIQQNETSVNRALRLSDEDTSTSATLPTATNRSNKYLGFDTNGNPIAGICSVLKCHRCKSFAACWKPTHNSKRWIRHNTSIHRGYSNNPRHQ